MHVRIKINTLEKLDQPAFIFKRNAKTNLITRRDYFLTKGYNETSIIFVDFVEFKFEFVLL